MGIGRWSMAAATALAALAAPAAGLAADIAEGETLAKEVCSRCHDIGPSGAFKTYPPSFASIAVFRSEEQIRGRIIFPPVHSAMPQTGTLWEPRQVDNLVAYIQSLEPKN